MELFKLQEQPNPIATGEDKLPASGLSSCIHPRGEVVASAQINPINVRTKQQTNKQTYWELSLTCTAGALRRARLSALGSAAACRSLTIANNKTLHQRTLCNHICH